MKKILVVFIVLFFAACSLHQEMDTSKSVAFVFKTPKIKLSDAGFIRSNENFTNVQIFTAGSLVLDLKLNEDICLNGPCYKREYFNTEFLGRKHYPSILDDILHARPIYEKKNLQKTQNGFFQTLHVSKDEISYRVDEKGVVFRDSANKILIKIKDIKVK